jgi:CRISPR system Cascade subunit CasC
VHEAESNHQAKKTNRKNPKAKTKGKKMLIEVHIIQNHAPSNLNRDDSGSPKSAIFGGYRRARISSQCLKRCYRTSKTFREEVDRHVTHEVKKKNPVNGMHSRSMPYEVCRRAGIDLEQEETKKILQALKDSVKDKEGQESTGVEEDKYRTAQSIFWRESELQSLAETLKQNPQGFDAKAALEPPGKSPFGITVDMALFGRMVTSKLMHNVEASSQFAHAISTHEWAREFDMWTRVDDRRDKRLDFYKRAFGAEEKLESGTDSMGDAEFTSACYYSYFNIDFDALIDNLTGKALKHDLDDSKDRPAAEKRACDAVVGLVKAAMFERPTGKFNSMATPSLPTLILVEIRDSHVAVGYADAFARPVDPKNEEQQADTGQIQRVDVRIESANRLIDEANRITDAFRRTAKARLLFKGGKSEIKDLEVRPRSKQDNKPKDTLQAPANVVPDIDMLIAQLKQTICPEEKKDE